MARKAGRSLMRTAAVLRSDVCDLTGTALLRAARLSPGGCDLLAGGPPCQAFSVFGRRRGRKDPRGRLVFEYLRILSEIRPRAFLLENVYGMLTVEGGAVFRELVERLSNPTRGLHYKISVHRANSALYGVPQFRDRVFIIGALEGGEVEQVQPVTCSPEADLFDSGELLPWRTVSDALRGLPPVGSPYPANHTGRRHSERITRRYAGLRAGERDPLTRINRLNDERPSFTIIVGSDKGGGKGHVHPREPREVTPRESARIQTFPDWWAFSGTTRHPIRQVGNAVPPLMGAAVGNALRGQLFGRRTVSLESYAARLDQGHLFSR